MVVLTSLLLVINTSSESIDTAVDPLMPLDSDGRARDWDSVGIAAVSPSWGLGIRDVLGTIAVTFLRHDERGFTGSW
jgi:hypothetical protein